MNKAVQKNTTQQTLFNALNTKNKKQQQDDQEEQEAKSENSQIQTRKSSRIQQQRIVQEQQSIIPQKKQSAKINSKQKQNSQKSQTQNGSQTTLNYLRKDSNNLQIPQIQSQSLSQDVSSIQSTIPSPSVNLPKKQNQQLFQKVVSDMNFEQIIQKIEKFQSFISSLLTNITNYLQELKNEKQQKQQINTDKIEKIIKYILFRFLTTSPFQMWSNLYCPQRVSQLIEESNGQLIQLWIRKYYKGIKDKLKGESLFGFVDSDDDFSEYFDSTSNNSNMNEEYTRLLNSNTCKNWKNKGNILIISGREGCGKTTALKAAIKSLKMQVSQVQFIIEINNSMKRGGTDLKKITEITQSCVLQNSSSTGEKQQNQSKKGTLNSFFAPVKKGLSQNTQEGDQQDQINIDAKDSSKKVIYFRNFDIQLDTLFQNEVFKLSEHSKVPFILSINQDNEQNLKVNNLHERDTVQFQPISQEQITILLYIIFEVERNYRKCHFLGPLYVQNLVIEDNETQQDTEMQKEQKESKEDIFLSSEEFNTFMINFPSAAESDSQYIHTINKLVHMFNGDLQTCLSFVQDNIKVISQCSEFATISKSIEYNQLRNFKLTNLNQIFLTDLPINEISKNFQFRRQHLKIQYKQIDNSFKFNTENTYQIFLNSSYVPYRNEYSQLQLEDNYDISELQDHLMSLENVQAIDILNVLDTIKTTYNVSSKRTRSQYNKNFKDITTNPQSVVEQTISKNLYSQLKLILSQFNLRKQNSFSQNIQKENQNMQMISNTLNVLTLQTSLQSNSSQTSLENEENALQQQQSSDDIKQNHLQITKNYEEDEFPNQQQNQKDQIQQQEICISINAQVKMYSKLDEKLKNREMEVETFGCNDYNQLKENEIQLNNNQDSENVDPNIKNKITMLNENDSKQKNSINEQSIQFQQNQVSQIVVYQA